MNFGGFLLFGNLIVSFSFVLNAQEKDRFFYNAVRSEASGDLWAAIRSYEKALAHGHSANLHGNLANLYFKTENLGKSILHYRKALLLESANPEFIANLSFTRDIAGLNFQSETNQSFLPESNAFWIVFMTSVIWAGFFLLGWLYYRQSQIRKILWCFFAWLLFVAASFLGFLKSNEKQGLLRREIIALSSDDTDSNQTSSIRLRRFAAHTSSANTSVKEGESLHVTMNQDGSPKSHRNSKGDEWFLVQTLDKRKKGWIEAKNAGWVVGRPQN